jgi:Family of unknown function (DUF6011)
LWGSFPDPKHSGQILPEDHEHGLPDIARRGFQLYAGGERGSVGDVSFEAQRTAAGERKFGPRHLALSYSSSRHHEWETADPSEQIQRDVYPRTPEQKRQELDQLVGPRASPRPDDRAQLRNRGMELAQARVVDFAGAPGAQMQAAGRLWGHCCICGKPLTDLVWLERGVGPACFAGLIGGIRSIARRMQSQDHPADVALISMRAGMREDFVAAILSEAALIT